ncbi:MAG: guanylate kinase [Deltaproteobacteria bacterium]|nr:guanylate kinase [Deltaproteobacteria bacterium]
MRPIIILSGPSGSGKTTLCRQLASHLKLHFSVSHTTRNPRGNEKNGVDYHFVSREEFKKREESGEFVESAEVYGNHYGTSVSEIEKGKGVILDVDPQGALAIKKKYPQALLLFIRPPTHDDLKERLAQRGTDSKEVLEGRLKKAVEEEKFQKFYDAVVVNQELSKAFSELKFLIEKYISNI